MGIFRDYLEATEPKPPGKPIPVDVHVLNSAGQSSRIARGHVIDDNRTWYLVVACEGKMLFFEWYEGREWEAFPVQAAARKNASMSPTHRLFIDPKLVPAHAKEGVTKYGHDIFY